MNSSCKLEPGTYELRVGSSSVNIAQLATYKVAVGASSLNIKQTAEFTLEKEKVVEKTNAAFALDAPFTDLKH